LKIAYDGRLFHGHQRQPDARTVEGECIAAAKSAGLFSDSQEAFFRSASRTDRGVSAIGNVIAFDTDLPPDAVVGALNDCAHDVWAWAYAIVPAGFHPRHATERWYRYHVFEDLPIDKLREAGAEFVGAHDLRSFTTDPPESPLPIGLVAVRRNRDATVIDVRARSFRRGMIRRIVAAMVAYARQETPLGTIQRALHGQYHDFGMMPPEPLFLMDIRYNFRFQSLLKPKVVDEWREIERSVFLRVRFLRGLHQAIATEHMPRVRSWNRPIGGGARRGRDSQLPRKWKPF